MPQYVFSNVKTLMQSVHSYLLDDSGAHASTPVSPATAYIVKDRPVTFVAKRVGASDEQIFLKRADWKTLSAGQRFRATVLSLFGLDLGKRTHLSAAHKQAYRAAFLRIEQQASLHINAQQMALRELAGGIRGAGTQAPHPLADGAERPPCDQRHLAKLREKVVEEFSQRLKDILPALRDQFLYQPAAVAEQACRKALHPLRTRLSERLQGCARAGMNETERDAIVRELGFEQCIARWTRVSREHADPASRTIAMSLARVDYRLNEIPTPQRHIDPTADAVLGDLHGNGRLLLHSMVSLGFVAIKNVDAWNAVCAQLASLETSAPDNDWRTFAARLENAVQPTAGAKDRGLKLIGDLVSERLGNDAFMAAILAWMDENKLDFKITAGNHEGEFLSYFLKNCNKGDDEDYSFRQTGVGMTGDQCLSLERLNTLLNTDREARAPFKKMVKDGFLKHLVPASFSRDGDAFYSHAFTNSALIDDVFTQAGINESRHVTELIRATNDWFQQSVLDNWEAFSNVYQPGRWQVTPAAPVSPLRGMMWNIGMDTREYGREHVVHPNISGIGVPPGFRYAVHGHCQDVANHVRGLVKRTEELERLLPRLIPLTDTSSHFLTGVRAYLPTLNRALAAVNAHTAFEVLDVLAPFVARRLHELRVSPDTREPVDTLDVALNPPNTVLQQADALCALWNTHGAGGDALLTLNMAQWPAPVRERMLASVKQWFRRPFDNWPAEVKDLLGAKQTGAATTRADYTAAIRANLPTGDGASRTDGRLTEEELNAYVGALKRRFFSIDDVAGSRAQDNEFNRLVHVVPRRPHGAHHHANV